MTRSQQNFQTSGCSIRKRVGRQLKLIWTAEDLAKAETALAELATGYRDTAPRLADWLEDNVPEGLAVFTLPEHHRKRLRTSNPIERSVQQEPKRRPLKSGSFPAKTRCCASSVPCLSRSSKNGPPTPRPPSS